MDENIRSKGATFQLVTYFFIAIIMTPLAIGGLASYPDPAWYFGLAFAVSATLMLYSAFSLLRKKRFQERENTMRQLELEAEAFAQKKTVTHSPRSGEASTRKTISDETATPIAVEPQYLLANWTYSAKEWEAFLKVERKVVFGESILLVALITGFGGWILHDDEDESWMFALTFSFIFSLIFVALKSYFKKGFINIKPGTQGVTALISRSSIVLNGKLFNLTSADRSLSKVEIIDKQGLSLVEFTYKWQTRSGATQDEIRLPVPEGRMEEARELVARMQ
jgi:hypothetical protein